MFYKLNMFLREWEGYDKVYTFLKDNLILVLSIRTVVYIIALFILFLTQDSLQSILRLIIYIPATIAEYFLGAIYYEQNEKVIAFSSYLLMILNIIVVIICSISLIFF